MYLDFLTLRRIHLCLKKRKMVKNITNRCSPALTTHIRLNFNPVALSNALLRIVFPDLWKFNKGTQNWLMKNFWAPDAVRAFC